MTRLDVCRGGCGMLVATGTGRCSACQRRWDAAYNRTRPEHHGLYRTSRWKRLAAEVTAGQTRCHWCLKPTTRLVADHVVPVELHPSGAFDRSNLVAACVGCNTRRGRNAKLPDLEDRETRRFSPGQASGSAVASGPTRQRPAPGRGDRP